jgi:hypothetical protein
VRSIKEAAARQLSHSPENRFTESSADNVSLRRNEAVITRRITIFWQALGFFLAFGRDVFY